MLAHLSLNTIPPLSIMVSNAKGQVMITDGPKLQNLDAFLFGSGFWEAKAALCGNASRARLNTLKN